MKKGGSQKFNLNFGFTTSQEQTCKKNFQNRTKTKKFRFQPLLAPNFVTGEKRGGGAKCDQARSFMVRTILDKFHSNWLTSTKVIAGTNKIFEFFAPFLAPNF